jgi:hypothetical protein
MTKHTPATPLNLSDDDFSELDIAALKDEVANLRILLEQSKNQFAALRDREQSIRAANVILASALELVMDHDGKLTGSDWTVIRCALERNIKVSAR